MLNVKTPDEALEIIRTAFAPLDLPPETVPLAAALGRVLALDVTADAWVPDFHRSTVDGYAVRASDTFGCSDALPAQLILAGEVRMGEGAGLTLAPGHCAAVPTGGGVPQGADAVQMLELCEDYGDGTIGVLKSVAPGHNMIFRGDDVKPGDRVLPAGRRLEPQDIGALAALGVISVPVVPRLRMGVISTGDELVPPECIPAAGQVRDVNGPLICAMLEQAGALTRFYGIIPDQEDRLTRTVEEALEACDGVILSGGSSVGEKDAACRIMSALGEVLFHGIAMKPGKPTLLGRTASGKAMVGLPGHPVAALFTTQLFVRALLVRLEGRTMRQRQVTARLTEAVSANHGRAQYNGAILRQGPEGLEALPIRGKSGLITTLAGADGYFCIPRDCEGFPAGAQIPVYLFTAD
ncbi:gephyrin-like molybdotransferase Glp [Pseudoflavonifractor phocaeensis]|uniref:molybdopterin molybdotransferase MoeA n=1 Tax=Pseudoflavonifractor phocaeensis TaxID=1870988 RepID=UPI001957A4C2|nr:gephyrin-like molybdotransferase Glp [Pseudoflavonifractor phocaeensis]MBM6926872.1 molybdopterin molybdenumtransferase MoeA [Pseudoflavonifractor phocaeensis]